MLTLCIFAWYFNFCTLLQFTHFNSFYGEEWPSFITGFYLAEALRLTNLLSGMDDGVSVSEDSK